MKRFVEADAELADHFTASIGVKAQSYEPSSTKTPGAGDADLRMCDPAARRALQMYAEVEATLHRVEQAARDVLRRVYEPFGTGFASRHARRPEDDAPDFLAMALAPSWGRGSFVRLAVDQRAVAAAFAKRWPKKDATRAALIDFLLFEAGRGSDANPFFRTIREECEAVRARALAAYDVVRVERVTAAKAASREEKARKEARRVAFLDEQLGKKRDRETARFERRIQSAS